MLSLFLSPVLFLWVAKIAALSPSYHPHHAVARSASSSLSTSLESSATTTSPSSSTDTATADVDGDAQYANDTTPSCDWSLAFVDLDHLNSAAGGLRSDCIAIYAIDTLITMLDTATANYTTVNDGYDEEFGYYVTYMEKLVPSVLASSFMFNDSAATDTMNIPPVGPGMSDFRCQTQGAKTSFACTDMSKETNSAKMSESATTLTLTNVNNYNTGLLNAGLSLDWVTLGDFEKDKDFTAPHGGRRFKYKFHQFPIQNSTMVVPNPKDIVTKALAGLPDLRIAMQATQVDMILGTWSGGAMSDPVQAYSTPVFMLLQAIDSMAQAKAIGKQEQQTEEKAEEERKKNLILMILSAVLMVVPFVGEEAASAMGLSTLARSIAIAGELGNGALDIYNTVNDPKSAIINILGMLVGIGAIARAERDGPGISAIAKIREGMSAKDIAGLGSIFKSNDDKLQSIMKVCKLP